MEHRYFPNMPPMFEIPQDRRQHHGAVEESFNSLGIAAFQGNGSSSYPQQNVTMGEAYCTSHRHVGGWPNGYFSSNLTIEGGHVRSAASAPSYNPSPRPPSVQSYYLPPQNNYGHGHHLNEFGNGVGNPVMNPERAPFKRKRDGVYMDTEWDSRNRFNCEASSSSSAQFHQEKACFRFPNLPSTSFPRAGGLSYGTDDHLRNVRSRPGVNFEANLHRSQISSYPPHHYGSSLPPSSHTVRTGLDSNSNITNHGGLPTNGNGRFTYPGNNRLICETSQHLAVRSVTENGWNGCEPIISRDLVLPPQYFHGPHGHPVINSSGPHGHPVINSSGPHGHPVINSSSHHLTNSLPQNRTNFSQYPRGHEVPQSETGLQFSGTSRFLPPAYVGSWHGIHRGGRSRRFHAPYNTVDAQNSLRTEAAAMSVDQSYLYSSGDLDDQYGDMRLDIDNMTYEELLALEERIGNVNTGLAEDAMPKCLMETIYGASDKYQQGLTCAVCLEEYEDKDKIGTLKNCGHDFHVCCIKKWLLMKKSCPICKGSAVEEK